MDSYMLIRNTNSYYYVNGNLVLNKNQAEWGGAESIVEGKFIIKGYILFDRNSARHRGGALHIIAHVNFIFLWK